MKELSEMSAREVRLAKAALAVLRMVGLTDEEIDSLPRVVRDYKEIKDMYARILEQQNRIVEDQRLINERFARMGAPKAKDPSEPGMWQRMGFDGDIARIDPGFMTKGGKRDG